jgi:hypothetical protein
MGRHTSGAGAQEEERGTPARASRCWWGASVYDMWDTGMLVQKDIYTDVDKELSLGIKYWLSGWFLRDERRPRRVSSTRVVR